MTVKVEPGHCLSCNSFVAPGVVFCRDCVKKIRRGEEYNPNNPNQGSYP